MPRGERHRCPRSRKTKFRTYEMAASVAARVDKEARVYNCPFCGSYHLTSNDKANYDRKRGIR